MELTQYEKIIHTMLSVDKEKVGGWFYPPDFMPPTISISHPHFVGYEASARFSELAKKYPEMIESRRDGKYFYRRIKVENIGNFFPTIPESFKQIFAKYGYNSN